MGWVGSGWVEIFHFLVGRVGLGLLQQKYQKFEMIKSMHLRHG